ncbi:hypothetical protein MA16_Dca020607 [Dendrobium catenatum]|uniref:Uncharacterized protein n=1 Tax=Dendrobium catenatum TaxID=906689 RepID=A0A2I0W399_9ASPA|nr:hypothetical protein MA16_Dca020607 [Dendrobium catenatum]
MDDIICAALEEVCVRGASGIRLQELWPSLQVAVSSSCLELSDIVKQVIWGRLASQPGLRFTVSGSSMEHKDVLQGSMEEMERIGLSIVAEEHMRDSFLGLYDLKQSPHFEISQIQRRVLERLAMARSSGVTQSELAKELDIKGTNFSYVVRNLVCQQLIVKQSTMVREKDYVNVENGPKYDQIVNTNLLHLSRYAKNVKLNPQQRIEITRSVFPQMLNESEDTEPCSFPTEVSEDCLKEDVHIKDYIPAMKTICEKLEASKNKVDVVSSIKLALGYRKSSGHRAWRSILYRLKYSGLVEEFQAKVNGKNVSCLRLIKKFDPKYFLPKSFMHGHNGSDSENLVKTGKRGQITDQLVEVPLEHRIYDMIDAEGQKGITILETSHLQFWKMKQVVSHFDWKDRQSPPALPVLLDGCLTSTLAPWLPGFPACCDSVAFIWLFSAYVLPGFISPFGLFGFLCMSRFFPLGACPFVGCSCVPLRVLLLADGFWSFNFLCLIDNQNLLLDQNELSTHSGDSIQYQRPFGSNSKGEILVMEKPDSGQELKTHSSFGGPSSELIESEQQPVNRAHEDNFMDSDVIFDEACSALESHVSESTSLHSMPVSSIPILQTQKYACRASTFSAAQREQRILEKLKNEKFLLKVELHKWLGDIEKDKPTTMDRKTLERSLKRLQDLGFCRCIGVHMPSLTNFNSLRYTEAILHPSVNPSQELVQQIYERQRSFDIQSRRFPRSARMKHEQSVVELPELQNARRASIHADGSPASKAMSENGFVIAKMVRVKLLHKFLWSYMSSSPYWQNALCFLRKDGVNVANPAKDCQLFSLDAAIKEMPLELFLQVGGSRLVINNLEKKCKLGLRLSDLSVQERRCLLDTQATSRLSSIVEILLRLRLVKKGTVQDVNLLSHALELKAYLEEPVPAVLPSSDILRSNDCYKLRHDFILSDKEAVELYWETLEYCFASADPSYSRQCFPGSIVEEEIRWMAQIFLKSQLNNLVPIPDFLGILAARGFQFVESEAERGTEPETGDRIGFCVFSIRFLLVVCVLDRAREQVFHRRSWSSIRVMTTEQRLELLKHFKTVDHTKKIPFSDCVKISRELNLTLEQVLRVYYDKRQARVTGCCNHLKSEGWGQSQNPNNVGSPRKRRRLLNHACRDHTPNVPAGELNEANERTFSDNDEVMRLDSCSLSAGENVRLYQALRESKLSPAEVQPQSHEEYAETAALISQCAFDKLKPSRKRKFSWTDISDRKLVMQYAKHRAMLGARFARVEWSSLCDLPAQPDTCKRRMATLNQNSNIRRAVLRLCNLLGERYTRCLDNSRVMANQESLKVDDYEKSYEGFKLHDTVLNEKSCVNICNSNSQRYCWDDFEDADIKLALEEVFKYKRLAKKEDAKSVGCRPEEGWINNRLSRDLEFTSSEPEKCSSSSCGGGVLHDVDKKNPVVYSAAAQNRSNNYSSRGKVLMFRGNNGLSQIYKSLSISNAIELIKVVFLSCSKSPRVQNLLARTLQKYPQGDIFAAFSYLREKNYLIWPIVIPVPKQGVYVLVVGVVGHGSRPFVLSRKFFHNVSSSPFPNDSGKRATNFSSWLQKQQSDLIKDGVAIAPDLQCGEVAHLFSLVLSGDFSISPRLPNCGIGEADEFKSSESFSSLEDMSNIGVSKKLKRKVDVPRSSEKVKKPKPQSKADGDRREKGFPSIKVFLNMETVLGVDAFECLGHGKDNSHALAGNSTSVETTCSTSSLDNVDVTHDMGRQSCWDAMTGYFELLASASAITNEARPSSTDFKFVHSVICQAGEQGLSMDEVSGALKIKGERVAEMFVDTLEVFQLAVKLFFFLQCYNRILFSPFSPFSRSLLQATTSMAEQINSEGSTVPFLSLARHFTESCPIQYTKRNPLYSMTVIGPFCGMYAMKGFKHHKPRKSPLLFTRKQPSQGTEGAATGTKETARNRGAKSHGKAPQFGKPAATVRTKEPMHGNSQPVNAFDSVRVVDASHTSKYFISVPNHVKIHNQGFDFLSCSKPQGISSGTPGGPFQHQHGNIDNSLVNPGVGVGCENKTRAHDMSDNPCEYRIEVQPFRESAIIAKESESDESFHLQDIAVGSVRNPVAGMAGVFQPILPWINGDGTINMNVYKGLTRRILGIIMQNPCILEEDIITKMDVLNPQEIHSFFLDVYVRNLELQKAIGNYGSGQSHNGEMGASNCHFISSTGNFAEPFHFKFEEAILKTAKALLR